MDTMSWFKHPRDLSNDKRMSLLINREGGKGYGTYLYIIETLFMQADGKLNFCQLDTMSRKGFSRKCMERVIRDYKLFIIQGEEFESAISFGQTKNNEYLSENSPTVARKTSNTGQKANKNEMPKSDDISLIVKKKEVHPGLARTREEKRREDKKRAEEEKEESAAATSSSDKTQHIPQPIRPWRELVDRLSENSSWLEIACMKSGYGGLLQRCLPEALKVFKQHVEAYGKGECLLKMSDVYSYFINFTRAGSRTSQDLRAALLAYETSRNARSSPTDNPYRHEQHIDGRRFYLGCPIPPDAPPRPDENAAWNEELHTWMAGRKHKPAPHSDDSNNAAQRSE